MDLHPYVNSYFLMAKVKPRKNNTAPVIHDVRAMSA